MWNYLQNSQVKTCAAVSSLRYYATIKVRKFELLFYKINTFLQKTTTCIGLQAEQIFPVNTWYTYFFNFGRGFCGSFSMLFSKVPGSLQNTWNFSCIVLLFVWAQKLCLRFLKSFLKLEILMFLSFGVSFLVDMFNWKSYFLTKKTSLVKSETYFSREAIGN